MTGEVAAPVGGDDGILVIFRDIFEIQYEYKNKSNVVSI